MTSLSDPRPSESGHWYAKNGTPVYEVPKADGKGMRAATLRDARKLDLVPGVTSIIKCAAAPQLERWKRQQVLLAALTLPRIDHEPEQKWLERVEEDWQEHGRQAAERGVAIHAAVQGYFEDRPVLEEWTKHVLGAANLLTQHFPKAEWICERAFAHPSGFGSKVDLHHQGVILDIKSKEFDAEHLPETYDEHAMQLGTYREGLQMPFAQAGILFVSASVPGLSHLAMLPDDELRRGFQMFSSLLLFWRAKTGHHP